jgi:hypothetical protein
VKSCAACGRTFDWRPKWAASWAQVRYCSDRCRGRRAGSLDEELEAAILDLLAAEPAGATISPSEAARSVFADDVWREQMQRTRDAARRLAARGVIEITQGGRVVEVSRARGPIRLRLRGTG